MLTRSRQILKMEYFIDVRAVQLDPCDLRGLPRIKNDKTQWVIPSFLPTSGRGILFLDELNAAPQLTQSACTSWSSIAPSATTGYPMAAA